jgi:hypothetical protein
MGMSAQALRIYKSNNYLDSAAGAIAFVAVIEAVIGNVSATHQEAAASAALSRTRVNLPVVAVALALVEDANAAHKIIDDLRAPRTSQVNSVYVPLAEALLQSSHGNTSGALQSLEPEAHFEMAPAFGFLPIYVRGLIYLRGRQGKEVSNQSNGTELR